MDRMEIKDIWWEDMTWVRLVEDGQVAEACTRVNKISVSCILVEFVTGELRIYPGDDSVLQKDCAAQDYSLL